MKKINASKSTLTSFSFFCAGLVAVGAIYHSIKQSPPKLTVKEERAEEAPKPKMDRGLAQSANPRGQKFTPKSDHKNEAQVVRSQAFEAPRDLGKTLGTIPQNQKSLHQLPLEKRSFQMALFNDLNAKVVVESVKKSLRDGYIIRGKIDGRPDSSVNLVLENGITFADIQIGRDTYEIRLGKGGHTVSQVDTSKLGPDDPEPGTPEFQLTVGDASDEGLGYDQHDTPVGGVTASANPAGLAANDASVSVTVFDVLIAYTPELKTKLGSAAAVDVMAQLYVDKANEAFQNSLVYQRARLVGTWEAESNTNASGDFKYLYGVGDGKWEGVHAKRAEVGADIVTLIAPELSGSCGIARTNAVAATAMSMVDYDCLSNHSLTHEMSHNMGAQHNYEDSGTNAYPYAYGYRDLANCFRDLMSYSLGCTVRINYLSSNNPGVTYNGLPVGAPDKDNARALNERRTVVAGFMQAVDKQPDGCSIKLQSFHAGTSLPAGTWINFQFTATGAGYVLAQLVDGAFVNMLDQRTENGIRQLKIRANMKPGSNYRIRLVSEKNRQCFDDSDGLITIGAPPAAILTMQSAGNLNGQWSVKANGVPAGTARVEFYDNGTLVAIDRSAPYCLFGDSNGGCLEGRLATNGARTLSAKAFSGTNALLAAGSLALTQGESAGGCVIKLQSFNAGESLSAGAWTDFQFTATGAGYVLAQLVDGASTSTLDQRTENGIRQLKIRANIKPGSNYRIRLVSEKNRPCFDDSDSTVSVR